MRKCRIGTAKIFTLLLLLYRTSVKTRGKYCTVECVQNSVPLNRLLGDMENMLGGTFIRVHRSYLVNAAHIVSVKRYELTLTNGDVLPIPKQRHAQVRREIALRIAE